MPASRCSVDRTLIKWPALPSGSRTRRNSTPSIVPRTATCPREGNVALAAAGNLSTAMSRSWTGRPRTEWWLGRCARSSALALRSGRVTPMARTPLLRESRVDLSAIGDAVEDCLNTWQITDGREIVRSMTTAEVLQLARHMAGQTLRTARGPAFTVRAGGNAPWFTPASTGMPRSDGAAALARFVARYNEIRSLRPGDYQDVTRNSS